eukprot:tig00000145_g8829.t1
MARNPERGGAGGRGAGPESSREEAAGEPSPFPEPAAGASGVAGEGGCSGGGGGGDDDVDGDEAEPPAPVLAAAAAGPGGAGDGVEGVAMAPDRELDGLEPEGPGARPGKGARHSGQQSDRGASLACHPAMHRPWKRQTNCKLR